MYNSAGILDTKKCGSSLPRDCAERFFKSSLKSLPNAKGSGVNLKTPKHQIPLASDPGCSKDLPPPPPPIKYTSKKKALTK